VVNEPSIVALNKKTGEVEAVGKEAKEMLGRTPGNIVAHERCLRRTQPAEQNAFGPPPGCWRTRTEMKRRAEESGAS
jgi:hypothetical protein